MTLSPAMTTLGVATSKILHDSDTDLYHCAHCTFVGTSCWGVQRHRNAEHYETTKRGSRGLPRKVGGRPRMQSEPTAWDGAHHAMAQLEVTLEALGMCMKVLWDEANAPSAKVDAEWKTRALAAEKSLRSLRKIIAP